MCRPWTLKTATRQVKKSNGVCTDPGQTKLMDWKTQQNRDVRSLKITYRFYTIPIRIWVCIDRLFQNL